MIPTSLAFGTEIVCINDQPDEYGEPTNVRKGTIYTVRGYTQNADDIAVLLNEISPPPFKTTHEFYRERGYYRRRFKVFKLHPLFEEMLETIKKYEYSRLES